MGGAIALCSSPAPPRGPLLPASPDVPRLSPMPPRTHVAWRVFWRAGDPPANSAGSPGPKWAGQTTSAPLPLFPESPSHLPLLISPASGVLILSGLHFSSPSRSPYILPVHSGVPPVSLGVRVPHQWPAGAPAVGRC